jgi:D-serine/D-alanine/glycine transporter
MGVAMVDVATTGAQKESGSEEVQGLHRGLSNRHIQFIALGGAIGSGLFMGAAIVSTVASVLLIFIWSLVLIAYLVYRKEKPELHAASTFKMPLGIPLSYFSLAFFVFIVALLALEPDTLSALYFMPLWFGWLTIAYLVKYRRSSIAKPKFQDADYGLDAGAN